MDRHHDIGVINHELRACRPIGKERTPVGCVLRFIGRQVDRRLTHGPHRLRDDQWNWIKDGLPGRAGFVGVTAVDDQRFVDAARRRYRIGVLSSGVAGCVVGPRRKPISYCNGATP